VGLDLAQLDTFASRQSDRLCHEDLDKGQLRDVATVLLFVTSSLESVVTAERLVCDGADVQLAETAVRSASGSLAWMRVQGQIAEPPRVQEQLQSAARELATALKLLQHIANAAEVGKSQIAV
jgi:hypothetical protein